MGRVYTACVRVHHSQRGGKGAAACARVNRRSALRLSESGAAQLYLSLAIATMACLSSYADNQPLHLISHLVQPLRVGLFQPNPALDHHAQLRRVFDGLSQEIGLRRRVTV